MAEIAGSGFYEVGTRRTFMLMAGLALCPASRRCEAQAEVAKDDASQELLKSMHRLASRVALRESIDGNIGAPVQLRPDPLFRFNNVRRNAVDATLWGWGEQGRPVAVMKVVRYSRDPAAGVGYWAIGMSSLSPNLVETKFRDGVAWNSRKPGLVLHPLPDAPALAKSTFQRTLQSKALSRRFTASYRQTTESDPNELRLLPTPLHRYNDPKSGLHDGALFSFALGTSPELILAIESRDNDAKEPAWFYGFGRISGAAITAQLERKEVWSQPYIEGATDFDTYMTRTRLAAMAAP